MKNFYLFLFVLSTFVVFGCLGGKDVALVEKGYQQILDNKLVQAETNFKEALKVNPDNAYAILNLGVVYEKTDRIPQAAELYNKIIKRNGPERAGKSTEGEEQDNTLVQIAKNNLAAL